MEQQAQTLAYFDSVAEEWRRKAEGAVPAVNVIAQRNACALRVRDRLNPRPKKFLDLGCGTGELALDMAASGVESVGVDFAPEMIAQCEEKRKNLGQARASFRVESVLELKDADGSYDLVAAMGLIEYLSPEQTRRMFARVSRLLRPGGAFVVGSRNRLFNVFSLSDYTTLDRQLGVIDVLLAESTAIAGAPDMTTAVAFSIGAGPRTPLPQPAEHPKTGIGVAVRYQYTPCELFWMLKEFGLEAATIFPVHYHALPVPAAKASPNAHVRLSNAVHDAAPEDHRLVPFSSTFVLDVRKA